MLRVNGETAAPQPKQVTPQGRIEQGVGVVGVRCAACGNTVLVVNAAEFQRDLRDYGAAYYVCRACEESDLEARLTANGDGAELLIVSAPASGVTRRIPAIHGTAPGAAAGS
ncbi:MAG TPA: hypothetical protein PKH77_26085 [Anaerolineae bacterium]|nr:hypothetical protein [Anaerolineae bacterium]